MGSTGFTFQRVPGALIQVGCVGPRAKDYAGDGICMVGGGRNEPISVWYIEGSQSQKVATREIEIIFASYSEVDLINYTNLDNMTYYIHDLVVIYLPNHTLIWDKSASEQMQSPIWHIWSSSADTLTPYRGQNAVYCYDRWIFGDSKDGRIGTWEENISTQYGQVVGWQFDTALIYNESRGFILHQLELVGLPGKEGTTVNPTIFHSYTLDGVTWSDERMISAGRPGDHLRRLVWRRLGRTRSFRGLRFRGADDNTIAFARLEAQVEGLNA